MANKACPNPKSKEWRNITEKVGVFEAFRVFIRNGYDVPTFIFKEISDVYKYLNFNASNNHILSKKDNKYFIPYGRDLGAWYTNNNLVKEEVKRINQIYNGLLVIKSKPVTKPDPRTPGRTKIEWVEVNEHALQMHYDIYNEAKKKDEIESGENIISIDTYEQRVLYYLKITSALMQIKDIRKTIRLNTKENPYLEQNLRKVLSGKGVIKEQIDFVFKYMEDNNIQSINTEDLAVRLASEFAYTVDSDIATKTLGTSLEDQFSTGKLDENTWGVWNENNILVAQFDTEQQAEDYLNNISKEPASYYSNLTVSGGTNYTENEIRTPDITPSIKGHAQFATDKGIGWFRSDEQIINRNEIPAGDLEEIRSMGYSGINFDSTAQKGTGKLTKTRRVLEVQSDLFQHSISKTFDTKEKAEEYKKKLEKEYNIVTLIEINGKFIVKGREKKDLITIDTGETKDSIDKKILDLENQIDLIEESGDYDSMSLFLTRNELQTLKAKKAGLAPDKNIPKNQFLQLLNKDNNWVKFFINTVIQDSAKKGYEKVLFPKGETAAKIEGHQTIADELKTINWKINGLKKEDKYSIYGEDGSFVGSFDNKEDAQKELDGLNARLDIFDPIYFIKDTLENIRKLEQHKQELKSQGIEKLKPIEAFYEIRIGNILKKIDPNIRTITDEHGNQWNEYIIKPEDHNKIIELQHKQQADKLTPENREDFEKKKEIMLKSFPNVKEVIEDYEINLAGSLEAQGTIIRVNPKYYTTDTIGHEFGHLLIDLVGGVDNPLIKKGIEQLKNSTIWESVMKRYPDLYENNIDKFYKEVLAQAIGEETAKIFDKQKDMSDFVRWLDRLFAKIKQILGIEFSVAKKLARKVLSSKEIKLDNYINENYESRVQEEILEKLEETKGTKTKIELLREKMLDILRKKEAIYKKRDFKSNEELISNTIKKIEDLDNDPKESLKVFQDFAIKETERIYKNYTAQDRKKRLYGEKFNLKQLSKWKDYVSGFSLLSEFIDLAKDYESDIDEHFLDIGKLNNALNRKNTIDRAYIQEGTELVADALSSYSSHIEAEYKEKFDKEYNSLSEQEKIDQTKEQYIREKLQIESNNIKNLTRVNIKAELLKASKDINQLSRWIDNVLDSPDVVVSSMAKMFVESDYKSRQEYIEIQNKLIEITRNLENFYKSNNILPNNTKEMYNFMLEKDSDNNYTQNIIDVYNSSLWDTYDVVKEKLSAEDIDYDEFNLRLQIWRKEHMPVDYGSFNPIKESFWNDLVKQKLITIEEKNKLIINDNWRTEKKKDVSEIVQNDRAVELIVQFYRDNLWKYRKPKDIYLNKQWLNLVKLSGGNTNSTILEQREAVKKNITKDPRIDFYNFITEQRDKIQLGIPYGHRLHTRLPSVLKSTEERIIAKENKTKDTLKHAVKSSINILSDETERGERILTDEAGQPIHFIPVYYTASIRKIYENEYDKLSEEEKDKINKKDYVNKKADENQSYDLASIYARYFNSAIEYKHKAEILPVMEMARDLVNNRETIQRDGKGNIIMQAITKGREKALTKAGLNTNIAGQLNDWFEAIMYSVKEKDEGTIFKGKVDIGKAANTLNKYTALNLLGLNFVQGTANTILGSIMQWIEASGGKYYTPKDYLKAKSIYGKNLPGIMGDIGSRKPNNLISLLLQKFDVLNEYDRPEFRKNSKFKQLLSTNTLFFTSHAGEHYMQTKVLLAMLNGLEAKDTSGKVIGKMVDMFYVENGKLKINDKVNNFSIKEQALFEAKVRRVLSSLHGEYTPAGRVAIQRYALGRMAYMFRKFIVPGLRRRWGKKNVNNLLGEYVEGNYLTTAKFVGRLFKDLKNFQFSLMATDWKSLTTMEKANIRKTLVELSFMIGASILASVLINMKEDSDDENWYLSFLSYQTFRLKTELWFFSNPSEAMKILRSPAASMSVIENSIKLIGQLMPPGFSGFEKYERGSWKGRAKVEKTLINFVPGMKQIYRLKYVDDQITWLRN